MAAIAELLREFTEDTQDIITSSNVFPLLMIISYRIQISDMKIKPGFSWNTENIATRDWSCSAGSAFVELCIYRLLYKRTCWGGYGAQAWVATLLPSCRCLSVTATSRRSSLSRRRQLYTGRAVSVSWFTRPSSGPTDSPSRRPTTAPLRAVWPPSPASAPIRPTSESTSIVSRRLLCQIAITAAASMIIAILSASDSTYPAWKPGKQASSSWHLL